MDDKITAHIESVIDILKQHLDECDLDELAAIATIMSGAEVWPDPDDSDVFEINTDTEDYGGLFDKLRG